MRLTSKCRDRHIAKRQWRAGVDEKPTFIEFDKHMVFGSDQFMHSEFLSRQPSCERAQTSAEENAI